jgi:hypothetical protein
VDALAAAVSKLSKSTTAKAPAAAKKVTKPAARATAKAPAKRARKSAA